MKIEKSELLNLQDSVDKKNGRKILLLTGYEKICMICGSYFRVQCHHKNGDNRNNKISNLEFRCISCHTHIHRKPIRDWYSNGTGYIRPLLRPHRYRVSSNLELIK